MHPAERAAAYLAAELTADERRLFEADLARDAVLRAQLDAMQRADEALTTLPATRLPDDAVARLDAVVTAELARVLDATGPVAVPDTADQAASEQVAAATAVASEAPVAAAASPAEEEIRGDTVARGDELAARRQRRWSLRAVGTVAAALVGVAVVGQAVLGPGFRAFDGGGGDSGVAGGAGTMSAGTSAPSAIMPEAADEDGSEAQDDYAWIFDGPADLGLDGPAVAASGRTLSVEDADRLLDGLDARTLADLALPVEEMVRVSFWYAAALGADAAVLHDVYVAPYSAAATSGDGRADGDSTANDGAGFQSMPAPDAVFEAAQNLSGDREGGRAALRRDDGSVTEGDLATIGRCLDTFVVDVMTGIPVTAELVVFDRIPAIAYTFLTLNEVDDVMTRIEVRVVDRATCTVRYVTATPS